MSTFSHRASTIALSGLLSVTAVSASASPELPDFEAANFVPGTMVDNPYFPIVPDLVRRYEGATVDDNGDPIIESFEFEVLGAGPTILGVQTTTLRDRAFSDGLLVEDTFDYYAQDDVGNVWYFGEDVTNYVYDENDNLIGTNSASSWRAGVNDALPGFIMPTNTTLGYNYYQEFAEADEALDQARVQGHLDQIIVAYGTFFDVLQVWEGSELTPDSSGYKYYARGFGLILEDEHVDLQLRNPEFSPELVAVSAVPVPATLPLLGSALLAMVSRRRRRP